MASAEPAATDESTGHMPFAPRTRSSSEAYSTYSAHSIPSGRSLSKDNGSVFVTPESSARNTDFASVYDAQSQSGSQGGGYTPTSSARTADFHSIYESQSYSGAVQQASELGSVSEHPRPLQVPSPNNRLKKKHRAFSAAFDAFASPKTPSGASSSSPKAPEPVSDASLDPTKVFSAARHARHKDVEAALAGGFDPTYADSFGNTLFHVACQNGNKRIAKLAIKFGGDMDSQNLKGNTGVHFLFMYGYQEFGEYFIEKGASGDLLNEAGEKCRECAKS